jgi:hypothetical protein
LAGLTARTGRTAGTTGATGSGYTAMTTRPAASPVTTVAASTARTPVAARPSIARAGDNRKGRVADYRAVDWGSDAGADGRRGGDRYHGCCEERTGGRGQTS